MENKAHSTVIEQLLEEYKDDPDFVAEELVLALGESITSCMEQRHLNRAELARRLGVSKAYVTKLLDGKPNMTLRTLASIAVALDADIRLSMRCKAPGAIPSGQWANPELFHEVTSSHGRSPKTLKEFRAVASAA